MKKLINEEISKRSSARHTGPSIVARLMGMDMSPTDSKSAVQLIEDKHEYRRPKSSKKKINGKSSVDHVSSILNSSRKLDLNSFYQNNGTDDADWCEDQKVGKPRREEHPQEEELQKFKREFEAWQAARFKECSRIVENDSIPGGLHAQENLNKGKTGVSAKSKQTEIEKTMEGIDHTVKAISHERSVSSNCLDAVELFPSAYTRSLSSKSRTKSLDFEKASLMNSRKRVNISSAPTTIVILKPGPDSFCNHEESWINSPSPLDQRGSIEDFLEEVKDRLRCELQGKVHRKGSVVRGSGIETPFSEQPSDPKQIARHIANHVRESVTRDLGANLLRSESTRSYRSEIQYNGPGSPEFIHRDTRRFLLERLRNVSERESELNSPVLTSGSYRTSALDYGRVRVKQVGDTLEAQKDMSFWGRGLVKDDHVKTRSFRHASDDDKLLNRDLSPRNLIRSLSAPVSGTSFGKLLLENCHILTGAHIQRKHEAIEHVSLDMKSQKKERFNFKEKVSNFRYSFTLKGKLFGKIIQSATESHRTERYPINDIRSGPTVITNFRERHDNFTEVPPSPVSVCSTARDEFCRTADCLSPISTPNATPTDDRLVPQAFRDISDNLGELRRQLNRLESDEPDDASVEQEVVESELSGLENPVEVYIRDLLVASGLYDGSLEKSFSRWDTFGNPISLSVFKEVEESYKKLATEHNSSTKDHNGKVNHKLLLDLLNEALSTILGPPLNMPKFRRKAINTSSLPPLRGKKLLDSVWENIYYYLYPPKDSLYHSLDEIVSRDLISSPWPELLDEDVIVLGREIETLIMRDIVTEVLDDMKF
ncbi:uncharacterized protein LOC126797030 isoform X2 [Argentina anserina]|nr:uncharacterized protein LOC126797030 isoform X2 [Potentilla anserina]XP_050379685.1 uncharacterized protein LOC126797030 isoform X2 [Potentilla anserina]